MSRLYFSAHLCLLICKHIYIIQALFLYTWLPFPQQITVTFIHCNNLDELMILDLIAEVHETVKAVFPDLN